MNEKSTILIVRDEQNRFGPDRCIRCQGIHNERQDVFAKQRWCRGMIGGYDRPYYPGHLRQVSGRDIRQKIDGKLWSERILMQYRRRILKILEKRKNIIRKNPAEHSRRAMNKPSRKYPESGVAQAWSCRSTGR